MKNEIEFIEINGRVRVMVERDSTPFSEYLMGIIKKDNEGFYRFSSSPGVEMTCKHLRTLSAKVGELNT